MNYLSYFLLLTTLRKSLTKQTENTCYTNDLGLDAHKRYININNLILVLLIWVNISPSSHENRCKSQNI